MNENSTGKPMTEADMIRVLSVLPKAMQPGRDPWSQIQSRILVEKKATASTFWKARNTWMGIAASFLLVALSSALFMQSPEVKSPAGPDSDPNANSSPSFASVTHYKVDTLSTWSVELEYQAAFKEFLGVDTYRPLPSGTAEAGIVAGWQEMQLLDAELRAALLVDPDNPLLRQRLLQLRSKQLELLHVIADSGQAPGRNLI